ncbi:MAG: hypothetical protein V4449_00080 [Patescibacteria group bacterium]
MEKREYGVSPNEALGRIRRGEDLLGHKVASGQMTPAERTKREDRYAAVRASILFRHNHPTAGRGVFWLSASECQ